MTDGRLVFDLNLMDSYNNYVRSIIHFPTYPQPSEIPQPLQTLTLGRGLIPPPPPPPRRKRKASDMVGTTSSIANQINSNITSSSFGEPQMGLLHGSKRLQTNGVDARLKPVNKVSDYITFK